MATQAQTKKGQAMLTQHLFTFFPLVVALAAWPRARDSEQLGKFSTLALIFACLAVSASIFIARSDAPSAVLLVVHLACFALTLFFSSRILRAQGLRWYDALVAAYAVVAVTLGFIA